MAQVNYDQQFNGVIGKVGIFDIKPNIKNMTVKAPGEHYGKQFNIDKTHTIAFKIADITDKWITIGNRRFREGYDLIFQVEQSKGTWVDVHEGSEVFFFWGWDGQYPKIDMSSFRLMKAAPRPDKVYTFGEKKDGGDGGNAAAPAYSPKGMLQGNAFNGSMILLKDKYDSPKAIETQLALKVINEEIKALHPNVNGATIGMAILAACKAGKKVGVVKDIALNILTVQIPALEAAWDGAAASQSKAPQQSAPPQPSGPDLSEIPDDDIPF